MDEKKLDVRKIFIKLQLMIFPKHKKQIIASLSLGYENIPYSSIFILQMNFPFKYPK